MKKTILFPLCLLMCIACKKASEAPQYSEMAAADSIAISEDIMLSEEFKSKEISNSLSFSYASWSNGTNNNQSGMKTALSSSAAKIGAVDSTRKFIRTAEIAFEAKNVVNAVYAIEDIAVRHGGFVQKSDLGSNKITTEEITISSDSTLRLTEYSIYGEMTLRVPAAKLDTTLKDIARWVEYLDYRRVKTNDVTLDILRTSLARKRNSRAASRMESAVDNRGRKLGETIDGEEAIANRQQHADEALLANLGLKDQIEYSTIQLSVHQQTALAKEHIANTDKVENYTTGVGYRFVDALRWGGKALVEVVLLLSHLWAFILIAAAVFGGVVWYDRRKKKS